MEKKNRNAVGTWLLIGVFMIVIQTLLGGITRLTESGLSITEWNVVSGTLPPLQASAWNDLFEKYQQSSQYHLLNEGMQLNDFKKIFWWEYIHRLWARMFLPVFLLPLIYFIIRNKINGATVLKSLLAVVLGALQGLVGWIMVASGLKDRAWVGAIELTTHFMLAMILLAYMMWIALQVFDPPLENFSVRSLKSSMVFITVLLFIQLCFGALMAGNHAALSYPTFPKFGSRWVPENLFSQSPVINNFFQNAGLIQLIHRSLGLVIAVLISIFFLRAKRKPTTIFFTRTLIAFPLLVTAQVLLGILTLLNSLGKIPVMLAAAHQMCAVLLLLTSLILLYQIFAAEKDISTRFAEQEVMLA